MLGGGNFSLTSDGEDIRYKLDARKCYSIEVVGGQYYPETCAPTTDPDFM